MSKRERFGRRGGGNCGEKGLQTKQSSRQERKISSNLPHIIDTFVVNSNYVVDILGKDGQQKQKFENQSRTTIKIGESYLKNNNMKTRIIIEGSEGDVQKVITMIKDFLKPTGSFDFGPYWMSERWVTSIMEIDPPSEEEMQEQERMCELKEQEKMAKLPIIVKNLYKEDPDVAQLLPEMVKQIRISNNKISIKRPFGGNDDSIPNLVSSFAQAFNNYPEILKELRKHKFEKPTPIQSQAWPVILSGLDVVSIAQTGTGKTLAYLLPALIHIDGQHLPRSQRGGASVLVLSPTRELAQQIEIEVRNFPYKDIISVCVYGGADRNYQIQQIEEGVDIIIGTPGRIFDLMDTYINPLSITFVVLDEADKMLSLGFKTVITTILDKIRPDKQIVMTSATWPENVKDLAESMMKDPVQIVVGSLDLNATHNVNQDIKIVKDRNKDQYLTDFLKSMDPDSKAIIFVARKVKVGDVLEIVKRMGISCDAIHGEREQYEREEALRRFRAGEISVLVGTDVVSRGLDILNVTHIVNYDFAPTVEDYIHRIGRTGRAGKKGESLTFFTQRDWAHASKLIDILKEANQAVPPELYELVSNYNDFKSRGGGTGPGCGNQRRGQSKRGWGNGRGWH